MEALGVEAEGDSVLAGRNDYGAEDVVGSHDVGRFAVDGALPARVVDVGEDGEALAVSLGLEGEGVGIVGG